MLKLEDIKWTDGEKFHHHCFANNPQVLIQYNVFTIYVNLLRAFKINLLPKSGKANICNTG